MTVLILSLLVVNSSCYSDKRYRFYNNLANNSVVNDISGNSPTFENKYYRDPVATTQFYGVAPIWTRLGAYFIQGSAVRSERGVTFDTSPNVTIVIWTYVLKTAQSSWLFGKVDSGNAYSVTFCIFLENGFLKLYTNNFVRRNLVVANYTTTDSHYSLGWNMISFSQDLTSCKLRSSANFNGLKTFTLPAMPSYAYTTDAILGGYRTGNVINKSIYGIVHTLWIFNTALTDTALMSYIAPRTGWTNMWDYYIGMFKDLTQKNSSNLFFNAIDMLGTNQNIKIDLLNGVTVTPLGLLFTSSSKIMGRNRNFGKWPGVTFHGWFTGKKAYHYALSHIKYFIFRYNDITSDQSSECIFLSQHTIVQRSRRITEKQ